MRRRTSKIPVPLITIPVVMFVVVVDSIVDVVKALPIISTVYGVLFCALAYAMIRDKKKRRLLKPHETDPLLLSPIEYEEHCADILRRSGWAAIDTPTSGDQGADIVATLRGIKAVIQCKRYGSAVGNAAVQQAVAAKAYYGAQVAVVVCPRGYTASAKALALKNRALLLSHADLPRLEQLARIP